MRQSIQLQKSKQYILLISVLHVIALIAFIALPMLLTIKIFCIVGSVLSYFYILYKFNKMAINRIDLTSQSELTISTSNGNMKVTPLSGSVITEFYICLYCKDLVGGKKYYFVLMKDSFKSRNEYRTLSAWLRFSVN